jgi:hypothetical protein
MSSLVWLTPTSSQPSRRALHAALWFMSSATSNQKWPRSCSTSQPDTPQVRRLSGQSSLWLRWERPPVVAEPHPLVSLSEAPRMALRVGRWGKMPPVSSDHVDEPQQHREGDRELRRGVQSSSQRDFKWCTRPPKDYLEKILEAGCPHHPYPVKQKLSDCTMMRRFMSSVGTPPGDDELARDPRGKGMVLGKAEVPTLAD